MHNQNSLYPLLKRFFDILMALIGLIVLSPLLIAISILIKLDSSGPVLYRGRRIGLLGRNFVMYKFRTMVANAEKIGPPVTYDSDPRITRVGRWLRSAHLDEFPQLWNVLRGEMSLVGPRPESVDLFDSYSDEQKMIVQMKPGVTGASQIAFRHEEKLLTDRMTLDQDYMDSIVPLKVELDMDYMRTRSLWLDFIIILKTITVLILDRLPGAHSPGDTQADRVN